MKSGAEIRREILDLEERTGDDYTDCERAIIDTVSEREMAEYNLYMARICGAV